MPPEPDLKAELAAIRAQLEVVRAHVTAAAGAPAPVAVPAVAAPQSPVAEMTPSAWSKLSPEAQAAWARDAGILPATTSNPLADQKRARLGYKR